MTSRSEVTMYYLMWTSKAEGSYRNGNTRPVMVYSQPNTLGEPGTIEHAREQAAELCREGASKVLIVKSVAEVMPAVDFFVLDENEFPTRIDEDGLSVEGTEEGSEEEE